MTEKFYEVSSKDGYVINRVYGDATGDDFEAAANEAVARKEAGEGNTLLCDIRKLRPTKIDIDAQTKGIGTLWKIRTFDKVAFLLGDPQVTQLLRASLEMTNLSVQFRMFEDLHEAVEWLQAK